MKWFLWMTVLIASVASAVDYPVAFLAHPRTTGTFRTQSVSEQIGNYVYHTGTDLSVIQPDGTESVLVTGSQPAAGLLAVQDFCVDLDGQSIIYSHIRNVSGVIGTWCDLYRVNVSTGTVTQLTNAVAEWNPPRGSAQFAATPPTAANNDRIAKGIHSDTVWNIGPCVVGDGSIVFCSNRQNMRAPSEGNWAAFQLFRMDADGINVRLIGHMNLGGALHPSISRSGRIHFSSAEQQGGRTSKGNGWAIWSMNPDGSDWGPEISAIGNQTPWHFQTEASNGSLVATQYYDTRIYGKLGVAPQWNSDPFGPPTKFEQPLYKLTPPIPEGPGSRAFYSYQRRGFYNAAPWAWINDRENYNAAGEKPGMLSHPAAIPGNGILTTWTGSQGDSAMNLGVYAVPDITQPSLHFSSLVPLVDKPDRHEWMGRPIVPFSDIYGLTSPPVPVGLAASDLPPGSPFGVITTSSMAWPEIVEPQFGPSTGTATFRKFTLEDAQYIRILAFNKTTAYNANMFSVSDYSHTRHRNQEGFNSAFNERAGSMGEVPLWKYRTPDGGVHYGPSPPEGSTVITDPEGKPDTSFRIQIPADTPWTFQALNAQKEAVGTAQTWHQVIPGEYRTCGGCHTHHGRVPFAFEQSFAATPEYETRRLDSVKLATWERDVEPIVQQYGLTIQRTGWLSGITWYRSNATAVDDDPRLTQEQAETIRLWIDTGMMSANPFYDYKKNGTPVRKPTEADKLGPYADTQGPTIAHAVFADRIILGLFDVQTGIDRASLSVTCSAEIAGRPAGVELQDMFLPIVDHRWELLATVPADAQLSVSVRDRQVGTNLYGEVVGPANLTSVRFPLTIQAATPIDPCPEEE